MVGVYGLAVATMDKELAFSFSNLQSTTDGQGQTSTAMLWYDTMVPDADKGLNILFDSPQQMMGDSHCQSIESHITQASQTSGGDMEEENTPKQSDQGSVASVVDGKRKRKSTREEAMKYAFLTRSRSDVLDDGYKWRKYGRKSVKSSPYLRNYYRCSSSNCPVKKTVERDAHDSGMLITTYQGRHNHQCPSIVYYIDNPFPNLKSTLMFLNAI